MISIERLTVASLSDLAAARRLVHTAAQSALGETRAADVELVTSELVTNALEHGAGPPVDVDVAAAATGITIAVASRSADLPVPSTEPAPVTQLRGRGLQIVSALSDHVLVTGADGHLAVVVRFDR